MTDTGMRKSDKWIPWYFVAFFVGLAILDGIFVYLATSTHTGVVKDRTFERGLAYNETVAAAEASEALGWKSALDLKAGSALTFTLADRNGRPISGADVTVSVRRPTRAGLDFEVSLAEAATGDYRAAIDFPEKGQWDLRVFVRWKQQDYQHSQRVIVAK